MMFIKILPIFWSSKPDFSNGSSGSTPIAHKTLLDRVDFALSQISSLLIYKI